jgi:hypothetical protein
VVEGGLNRVPLPELPPPPARGRTRTLRQNYLSFGSIAGLSNVASMLRIGSAWTTFSFTSTSCRISPSDSEAAASVVGKTLPNFYCGRCRIVRAWTPPLAITIGWGRGNSERICRMQGRQITVRSDGFAILTTINAMSAMRSNRHERRRNRKPRRLSVSRLKW